MCDQIFDILKKPFVQIGRAVAFLDAEGVVRKANFSTDTEMFSFSAEKNSWQYTLASVMTREEGVSHYKNKELFYLNKASGQRQTFDIREMPFGVARNFSPKATLFDDQLNGSILGKNYVGYVRDVPQGYYLFHLGDTSLSLHHKEPIPYYIWTSWIDGNYAMMAGMSLRVPLPKSSPDEEDNYARGAPAIIRCDLKAGQWETIPFMDSGSEGVDLIRDWPEAFPDFANAPHMRKQLKAEAWVGAQSTPDGDRILLAGMGRQRFPIFDALSTDWVVPMRGDYRSLALLSYRDQRILRFIPNCWYFCTFSSPDRDIFLVIMDDGLEPDWSGRKKVSQLHAIDPLKSGTDLVRLTFDGISSDQVFTGGFEAGYFHECGFFGAIQIQSNQYFFVTSRNGIDWKFICDSNSVVESSSL